MFLLAWIAPLAVCAQSSQSYSGIWKQEGERCIPKRVGEVVRHIDQENLSLVVKTDIARAQEPQRHAVQRYRLGGEVTSSTGADGDLFLTSVLSKSGDLVFSIEEHEGSLVLHSTETWTLLKAGSELQIHRVLLDGPATKANDQFLIYLRQSLTAGARK